MTATTAKKRPKKKRVLGVPTKAGRAPKKEPEPKHSRASKRAATTVKVRREVECPTCGAKPGQACTPLPLASGKGRARALVAGEVHEKRWRAYERAQNAAPAREAVKAAPESAIPHVDPSDALRHPCPHCGAPKGKACGGGAGGTGYPHEARRALALAAGSAEPTEPALRIECPTCHAAAGAPCTKRKRPIERPHEARVFAELGLDQRCPDCGVAPYVHCIDAEDGTPLVHKSKGKLVTHAGRRTLALAATEPAQAEPAPYEAIPTVAPDAPPDACYECGHTECPIYPDCSGCSACAAARDPEVERRVEEAGARMERELEAIEPAASAPAPRPSPGVTYVPLPDLRRDGGTQPRAAIDPAIVEEYAEAYRCGARMPPLIAFFDGESYWLADGFHRAEALERAEIEEADVDVRQGTRRDAVLFSVGANSTHGLRRTSADKRRAISTLLRDEEWGRRSDRWIAEQCGVGNQLVGVVRRELCDSHTSPTREGQDGKVYPASQPSRPTSNPSRTTVELDGDPGPPEEPVNEQDPGAAASGECRICHGLGEPDGCPVCERVECSLCYGQVAPGERCPACNACGASTNPSDAAGAGGHIEHGALAQGGKSDPSPSPVERVEPAKPRKWWEVLELAPRPDPMLVVEQHRRLSMQIGLSDEERAELDRAKSLGLSQWETMPDLADRMVELAGVAAMDHPCLLESSAGTGQIVEAMRRACGPHAHITAHELDPVRVEQLRRGAANMVHEGDFLAAPVPSHRYDASINNTPYEGGLDGRFLERLMECAWRVVALCRINVLVGKDRCERVWSRVKSGEWHLADQVLLEQRPEFVGPGDESARSDYVVVHLVHASISKCSKTRVDWW